MPVLIPIAQMKVRAPEKKGAGKKSRLTTETPEYHREKFREPYPMDKFKTKSQDTEEFEKADEVRKSILPATVQEHQPELAKDLPAPEPGQESLTETDEKIAVKPVFQPEASEKSEEGSLITTAETSIFNRVREMKKVPSRKDVLQKTRTPEPAPPAKTLNVHPFFFNAGSPIESTSPSSRTAAADSLLVDNRETLSITSRKTVTTLTDSEDQYKRVCKENAQEVVSMTERNPNTPNVVVAKARSSCSFTSVEETVNTEDGLVTQVPSHAVEQKVKREAKAPISKCVFKTSFQQSESSGSGSLVAGASPNHETHPLPDAAPTHLDEGARINTSYTEDIVSSSNAGTRPNYSSSWQMEPAVASGSLDARFGVICPTYSKEVSGNASPNLGTGIGTTETLGATLSTSADKTPNHGSATSQSGILSPLLVPTVVCKWCGETYLRTNPSHAIVCFGFHEETATMASVPENIDEKYDLHVADEDDVTAVLTQAWSDELTAIISSAVWTMYRCSPNGFYVVRERGKSFKGGGICAAAAVVTFEDEISFCAFFHLSRERAGYGISRLLWNQIIHFCTGKNVVTVMPHEVAVPFLRRYHFNISATGDLMYGLVKLHSSSFAGSANVRDYQGDRDFQALVDYDRSVFGFGRRHYLMFALAEAEQMVKIATTIGGEICGYVGVQREQRGWPVLRWLLANDAPTAEGLLLEVVSSCEAVKEQGVLATFYTSSPITNVILNKVDVSLLEPWVLIYSRREPFCRFDRIISLTYI